MDFLNLLICCILIRFHWSLYPVVLICQHRFRYQLGIERITCHYLNDWANDDQDLWRCIVSLSHNELTVLVSVPFLRGTRNWPSLCMHMQRSFCVRIHKMIPVNVRGFRPSVFFRLVLQNFAIPGYFPYILFYRYLFSSSYFLQVGLLLQCVALFQSGK